MFWFNKGKKNDLSNKSVTELWNLVLKRINKKDKGFSKGLRQPADISYIQSVEKKLNISLPSDLKELYMCNDGEGDKSVGCFCGLGFMSLENMLHEWRFFKDCLEKYDEKMKKSLNSYCT